MPIILIVEDNETIRDELAEFLKRSQFQTICPESFDKVEELIKKEKVKLVLLDINLKERDGFDICKKIREVSEVPVLFVTGRNSEMDELQAMELGGDDYIRKPYSLPILLAKIKRILQRSKKEISNLLYANGVCLDIVQGLLKIEDQRLELSKNEEKILYYLFLNKGKVVSKDDIIEYLWENKMYVDENILNVNLSRLRKRLSGIGLRHLIQTIPKQGYRIMEGKRE